MSEWPPPELSCWGLELWLRCKFVFVYLARTQTQDARRVEMVKWRGGRYSISGLLGDSLPTQSTCHPTQSTMPCFLKYGLKGSKWKSFPTFKCWPVHWYAHNIPRPSRHISDLIFFNLTIIKSLHQNHAGLPTWTCECIYIHNDCHHCH